MDWSSGDATNLVAYEIQVFSIPEIPDDGDEEVLMGITPDDLASRLGIPGRSWKFALGSFEYHVKTLGLSMMVDQIENFAIWGTCFKDSGWDSWENAGETVFS